MSDWISQNGFKREDAANVGVPLNREPNLSEQQLIQNQAAIREREDRLIAKRGYGYTFKSDYFVARFLWKLMKLAACLAVILALVVGGLWIAAPTMDLISPDRPLKIAYSDSAQTLAGIQGAKAYAHLSTTAMLTRLSKLPLPIRVTAANAPMVAAAWATYRADPHSVASVSFHNQNVLGYWFMALMHYQISRGPNAAAWHDAGMLSAECSHVGFCNLDTAHRTWANGAMATGDAGLARLASGSGTGATSWKERLRRASFKMREVLRGPAES